MDIAKALGDLIPSYIGLNILNDGGFETANWTNDWDIHTDVSQNNSQHYEGEYSARFNAECPAGLLRKIFSTPIFIIDIEFMHKSEFTGSLNIAITYDDNTTWNKTISCTTNWTSGDTVNPYPNKKVKQIDIVNVGYNYVFVDNMEINEGITLVVKYDEFDIKDPLMQLLIENFPAKSTWIIEGVYRIEHRVRLTLYRKLIHYGEEFITSNKDIWFAAKKMIDKVIIKNKFNLSETRNLISGTWTDNIPSIAVGRGWKNRAKEPILWQSEQIVTCVYYYNEELINE